MADFFKDISIVACRSVREELETLQKEGFLDTDKIFYVSAGSHEHSRTLEEELPPRLEEAKAAGKDIIVVLGTKCYFNFNDPDKNIDNLIKQHAPSAIRIPVEDCFDMLTDKNERKEISARRKLYWLTPGWMRLRDEIFKGWDAGKANETFPMHDTAVMLDSTDYFTRISMENPEDLLGFSDWMGISIEPYPVTLDRFRKLLADARDLL